MNLDIKKLLRPGAELAEGSEVFDFRGWDFYGYEVPAPVRFSWRAAPAGGVVRLAIVLDAEASAECARCLEPASQPVHIEKEYAIREEDLREEYPQFPILSGGLLDLREMAYGELVIEGPVVVLCREDCGGLCQQCGRPQDECGCEAAPEGDPRLQVLRQLLQDEDD